MLTLRRPVSVENARHLVATTLIAEAATLSPWVGRRSILLAAQGYKVAL